MLDGFGAYEEKQDKRHNEKYEAEGERCVVCALGKLEQVAEASSRCDKLANDRTGKSETDCHLEAAEHPGRDRGNIDLAQQEQSPAAQGFHAIDQKLIDILDAAVDGEEYEDSNQDYRESNLGREFDAQPNHKQRREDDSRNGVQKHHDRLKQLGNERN